MPIRLTTLAAAALLALPIALPIALAAQTPDEDDWLDQCRSNDRHNRATVCEVRHQAMRPSGALAVDARENGAIIVRGWDRDSIAVDLRIQAQAPTEQQARDILAAIRVAATDGTLRADGPASANGAWWSVSYEIHVPRRTDLTLDTRNGPLAVEHVRGKMELRAVNGPLALTGAAGDVHGRTTNGPLAITLDGTTWDGAGLDAETSNGPVVLTVPEHYSARLETGTVNGPIDVDIPITITGRFTGKRITTTLGNGGPPIRAVTTNGPLSVRRS